MVTGMYEINDKINKIFINEGICCVGVIPACEMMVINPRLIPDADIKSCIVFLVPYKTDDFAEDTLGVSVYARAMDYHIYFDRLFGRIISLLEGVFEGERFFGFADHSPINEKLAAARAGLGVFGRNSLLINDVYGSYVFIGSLLTTLDIPAIPCEIGSCIGCSLCVSACPTGAVADRGIIAERCLSYISQKKNKSDEEKQLLKENKTVWGCDICQSICTLNKNKKLTEIDFFRINRLNNITEDIINSMPDDIFRSYPFSWRGKENLLQNIRNGAK
ncbi:MAG: hypothetical protein CVU97_06570 [Firmicutes bacterium HGW-Firmicutes-21]|nr:MAG: hypothetical protein CVU97_06570 [Firmicutes bacterium HGW-Firmicutes-21]